MKTTDTDLLISIIALIVGGVQLIPPHNQSGIGWICIFVAVVLFGHFLFRKVKVKWIRLITEDINKLNSKKRNPEEIASALRTIDEGLREKAEQLLNFTKGTDKTSEIWTKLNPIQAIVNSIGLELKKIYLIDHPIEIRHEAKTRLDLWDEFLESTKQKAEKILLSPSEPDYLSLYKNFDAGLKTALKENHEDYSWFKRVTYEYSNFKAASALFPSSFGEFKSESIKKLTTTILQCIRYFQSKDPQFTELDFRDFELKNFKRYF